MSMPGVAMIVRMAGMAVAMIVAVIVRKLGHQPILPTRTLAQPSNALIRHFDTALGGMD
jgi:hypothetical protein